MRWRPSRRRGSAPPPRSPIRAKLQGLHWHTGPLPCPHSIADTSPLLLLHAPLTHRILHRYLLLCFAASNKLNRRPGRRRVDPGELGDRAAAAASMSGARYNQYKLCAHTYITCELLGQPQLHLPLDGEGRPRCVKDPCRWEVPPKSAEVKLAFAWSIARITCQPLCQTHLEAGHAVVSLNNAEKNGVPLPAGWGPVVAAYTDAGAEASNSLVAGRDRLAEPAAQKDDDPNARMLRFFEIQERMSKPAKKLRREHRQPAHWKNRSQLFSRP